MDYADGKKESNESQWVERRKNKGEKIDRGAAQSLHTWGSTGRNSREWEPVAKDSGEQRSQSSSLLWQIRDPATRLSNSLQTTGDSQKGGDKN